MTPEEHRRAKTDLIAEMEAERSGYAARWADTLDAVDGRIMQYADGVLADMEAHNLYELLALRRFFTLLDRYTLDAKAVRHFFRFYESLKFSGKHGRQRYALTPVQCFQFASIYGFKTDTGQRLTRLAYIFVPRKFSKTTAAAAMAVYDLFFGDSNAQAYIGANGYNQAKICFDEIRAILFGIDPTQKFFRINREKVTYKDTQRNSFIECLTANARTKDGLNASLIIMDEYAQARDTAGKSGAELKNVLTSSMGVRENPLTVIITTASDVVDGAFAHELAGAKSVLRGDQENDRMFAAIFEAEPWDREDDPATWAKVQPHMGVTIMPDFYANEYKNAQISHENMLAFRTKLLNVFTVNEAKRWFTREQAEAIQGDFDIHKVTGRPRGVAAFDLSVKDDFSAVAYMYWSEPKKKYLAHVDYYFPSGSLSGHPNEYMYRRWAEQGYLRLLEGAVINYKAIGADMLEVAKKVDIRRVSYDAYKAQELRNYLAALSADRNVLHKYKQTIGNFNLPTESFEMAAFREPPGIEINRNPITTFCLMNCVIMTDNMDNRKPFKRSPSEKIDGVIALLMALGSCIDNG